MTAAQILSGKDARTATQGRVDSGLVAEGTPRQAPTFHRPCDWCGKRFTTTSQTAKTDTDHCRITLSRWRRGEGPFAPGGTGQVDGRGTPANPKVAREHRDRDQKRAARARGPIRSDLRLQRSRAIEAGAAAVRSVARVNERDAVLIATREVDARMPGRRA